MTTTSRRNFLKLLGASSLLSFPSLVSAQSANPKVVVVGGGFAGATVAKYLRKWSNNTIDVTLVVPESAHRSCILSNLVVTGKIQLSNITFGYASLAANYGINFVQDLVTEIIPSANGGQVRLGSGNLLSYDRLVVAPGVSFDAVTGLEADLLRSDATKLAPHAWIAGDQTLNLRAQLKSIPKKGTFLMTIPAKPYRCPPGPYERACVVADYLKRNKKGSKLIVLDANPGIVAEPVTFTNAFNKLFKGIVQYIPNAELTRVELPPTGSGKRTAFARLNGAATETAFKADVLNIIPRHKAGSILFQGGLGLINVSGRWAGVDARSYESTAVNRVHIIGDSQATGQPKAGHIANQEAKVCADAIIRIFGGSTPHQSPVTNSACYSPITDKTASWLTAVFQYDPLTGAMVSVPAASGEAPSANGDHFEKMFAWAENLFSDTFM